MHSLLTLLCVYIKQMPKNSVTIHTASNTFYIIPWKVYPRPCWRMADNRELTCSQAISDEEQPLLQQTQPIKPKRCCHHLRIRKVRSKGAVVVLVWIYFLILSFFNPVYNMNTKITLQGLPLKILAISGTTIIFLIGPLAGLVATVYCGRYRVVSWSLWIIWIGNIATVPMLILQRLYPAIQDVLIDFGVVIAETVICFGMVVFLVNCVPFGLDQMPDASGGDQNVYPLVHVDSACRVSKWVTASTFTVFILAQPRFYRTDVVFVCSTTVNNSVHSLCASQILYY